MHFMPFSLLRFDLCLQAAVELSSCLKHDRGERDSVTQLETKGNMLWFISVSDTTSMSYFLTHRKKP